MYFSYARWLPGQGYNGLKFSVDLISLFQLDEDLQRYQPRFFFNLPKITDCGLGGKNFPNCFLTLFSKAYDVTYVSK